LESIQFPATGIDQGRNIENMDAYEKLFIKMEAKKKLAEIEEANKELSDKTEVEKKLPVETVDEKNLTSHTKEKTKQSVNMEAKEKPLEENGYQKKQFAKMEAKKKAGEIEEPRKESSDKQILKKGFLAKSKTKLSYFTKLKLTKKPFENDKPGKKPDDQLKVFKLEKGVSTVKIIDGIEVKDDQLRGHALLVDCNIDENSFKDNKLIMIKNAGIYYIIAPGFTEGFCKKVASMGLHLIECSGAMFIGEGSKIEFYLEDSVVFDVDNGNEYKFKMMTGSPRKKTSFGEISLGECLLIGDNLKITVLDIDKDLIKLCVNALKVITVYLQKSISLDDVIHIKVLKINLDQINIAIDAPENITIKRE
jgi:sRNA-binding carbon storage regulator CsrA